MPTVLWVLLGALVFPMALAIAGVALYMVANLLAVLIAMDLAIVDAIVGTQLATRFETFACDRCYLVSCDQNTSPW
jgi:hypothetical protein